MCLCDHLKDEVLGEGTELAQSWEMQMQHSHDKMVSTLSLLVHIFGTECRWQPADHWTPFFGARGVRCGLMVPCADVALKHRWAVSMPRNVDPFFFVKPSGPPVSLCLMVGPPVSTSRVNLLCCL